MVAEINSLEGLKNKFEEEIIRDTVQKSLSLTYTRENLERIIKEIIQDTFLEQKEKVNDKVSREEKLSYTKCSG